MLLESPSKSKPLMQLGMNFSFKILPGNILCFCFFGRSLTKSCALWAFVSNWNNPEQCLIDAVGLGGDTDTIAAIAGALAGALHGTHWIPKRWFNNLENGSISDEGMKGRRDG